MADLELHLQDLKEFPLINIKTEATIFFTLTTTFFSSGDLEASRFCNSMEDANLQVLKKICLCLALLRLWLKDLSIFSLQCRPTSSYLCRRLADKELLLARVSMVIMRTNQRLGDTESKGIEFRRILCQRYNLKVSKRWLTVRSLFYYLTGA